MAWDPSRRNHGWEHYQHPISLWGPARATYRSDHRQMHPVNYPDRKYCHNPTQQQLNLTRLRLDIIIKPNPPHPHTQTIQNHITLLNHKITVLNRHITLLNPHITLLNHHITLLNQTRIAWCEADIRLSEELATEGYRQVQEGTRGYARVRECTRVYKLLS